MITAITQARGDMPAGPDPVSVALEAAVKNDRAVAMIRASWILAERFVNRNYWPVLGATARAQVDVAGDVAWPREPFPSALIVDRRESTGWGEVDGNYVPEFGLLVGLAPGRYRIRQTVPVVPEDPPEHVLEAVRALALYQLIHSAARREFRTMGAGDSTLTREALDGLFRASGAGILLAGGGALVIWPFSRRKAPEIETRAAFPSVTAEYLSSRRSGLLSDSGVPLSATIATCAQTWSRAFAMLDPGPDPSPLTADVLAAIGLDLCLRGAACFHVRVQGNELALHRVAYWDLVSPDRFVLHIARPHSTETVRALAGEVVLLTINSPAEQPWQGRPPWALMGGSPALMAEIEAAVSGATEWVGRGLVAFPPEVPEEQQASALQGLKAGGRLAAIKSRADFATSAGQSRGSEFKRIELGPDLESADLNETVDQLHRRLLAAAGIPPALFSDSGAAGGAREAYRLFVLQTIEPMARQLLPELRKAGVTSLGTGTMSSQDVAGRARAVGTLVGAGMSLADALAKVGWDD